MMALEQDSAVAIVLDGWLLRNAAVIAELSARAAQRQAIDIDRKAMLFTLCDWLGMASIVLKLAAAGVWAVAPSQRVRRWRGVIVPAFVLAAVLLLIMA